MKISVYVKTITFNQQKKRKESKNEDVNVITFVSTSSVLFLFELPFLPLSAFHFSVFFISKTVKATNKLYKREMTLSVKIKKKMDFPVPSYCSPLLSSSANAKGDFVINNERKLSDSGNHQKSVVIS